ncbi:MAG: hypothetical protein DLM67_04535 [Candidatus Nephthysia bennettiae]|nr:MAG: hypothetical protein DLM67_04535 [Candidatus Dormibacteraeota bacterium]
MQRCSICEEHYFIQGESRHRRDDRLTDHRRRVTVAQSPSAAMLAEYRERVQSALRSRDSWRGALVEVMVHHEASDEGCRCGAPHYPCPSAETLERVNRGIARRVEHYLSLPVEEMERQLYREDSWPDFADDVG